MTNLRMDKVTELIEEDAPEKQKTDRIFTLKRLLPDELLITPLQVKQGLKQLEDHIQLNQERLLDLKQNIIDFSIRAGFTKEQAEAFFETTLPDPTP